jgi:hypothetical protein
MRFKKYISEANNGIDIIKVTVPLFIKLMEWARENAKSDLDVHKMTEAIVSKGGTLTSDEFETLLKDSK